MPTLTLSDEHLKYLGALLGEIPMKYAAPVASYLNSLVVEQTIATEKQSAGAGLAEAAE